MGFFDSIFGNKVNFECENWVWLNDQIKQQKLYEHLELIRPSKIALISFFKDLHVAYPVHENIHHYMADDLMRGQHDHQLKNLFLHNDVEVVFTQHHPIFSLEENVLNKLAQLSGKMLKVVFFFSLEDPILLRFSGDKLKELVIKLGLDESEMIKHSLIDKSIVNAQKKIETDLLNQPRGASIQEWFNHANWKQ